MINLGFGKNISLALTRNTVLVALSLSLVFGLVVMVNDFPEKQASVRAEITRVVNAVRWPAAEAVYSLDSILVEKSVKGLTEDLRIDSVTVIDDFDTVQFSFSRSRSKGPPQWLVPMFSDLGQMKIQLYNPRNSQELVGVLLVGLDDSYIAGEYLSDFKNRIFRGFVVDLLLALILMLFFHFALTRPLLGMTRELSMIDPNSSEQARLTVPVGHEKDELGQSITAVNRLLSRVEYVMERRRQAEQTYLDMFQSAPIGLFKGRMSDGRVLDLNDQLAKMYGFSSREEFLTAAFRPKECMVDPELRDRFMELAGSEGGVSNFEAEFVRADGSKFWGRLSGRRAAGSDIIDGILEDITARRLAEERYRIMSENAPVGIAQISAEGRYLYANQHLARMYGYASPEELMREITDIQHQLIDDYPDYHEMVEKLNKEDSVSNVEYAIIKKDGSRLWTSRNVRAVRDLSGEISYYDAFVVDISDRKAVEEELVKARDAAEAASVTKGRFLANMSHEIRTPLNGVLGMLQLTRDTDLGQEQREYVETALSAGKSLLNVLNDILDYSRVEAGKMELLSERFSPAEMIQTVSAAFAEQVKSGKVKLNIELDPSLPEKVVGDSGRIRQVLFNLVGNAFKFTPVGTITIMAWGDHKDENSLRQRLLICVSDTGIGIPDEMVANIFESFTQVDSSLTKRHGGSGLGLGIVKSLVILMGGSLSMDTREGVGTNIFLSLPVGITSDVQVKKPEEVNGVDLQAVGLNVLLAEDNPVNRLAVKRFLEKLGHRVVEAPTGKAALAEMKEKRFDCVLMDIQMPEMDGMEATRAIRSGDSGVCSPDVPIVALTAYAMKGDGDRFVEAGMDFYLPKPVELDELIRVLNNAVAAGGETL